jgi:hypothetical protein
MLSLIRFVLRFVARVLFRVQVRGGLDHLNADRLLIVANHESLLDGLFLGLFLPVDPVFVVHTGVVTDHPSDRGWPAGGDLSRGPDHRHRQPDEGL